MFGEVLHDHDFFLRQLRFAGFAFGAVRAEINPVAAEFVAGRFQRVGCVPCLAAEHGPDAEQKFLEIEWFGDVIVAPGHQSGDAVVLAIAGGQEQYRETAGFFTDRPADFEAVLAGKHNVEQDQVEISPAPHFQGRRAVAGDDGFISLRFEIQPQAIGDMFFVLDDQDTLFHEVITGKRIVNVEPLSFPADLTLTDPPCAWTI